MLTSPTRNQISCQFLHVCSAPASLLPLLLAVLMTDANQNTHHPHSVSFLKSEFAWPALCSKKLVSLLIFYIIFQKLHKLMCCMWPRCPERGRENERFAAFSNLNIKHGNRGLSNMIWCCNVCEYCTIHPWGNLILGSLHLPWMVSTFELWSPLQDNEFWADLKIISLNCAWKIT